MIAKRFRLSENEVKKVLQKKRPFFSYGITANVIPNTYGYARIAIILSRAQTRGSVNRNTLRRHIYDLSATSIPGLSVDIVYILKKKTLLDSKDSLFMAELTRDIPFLMKKIKQEGGNISPKTSSPFKIKNPL